MFLDEFIDIVKVSISIGRYIKIKKINLNEWNDLRIVVDILVFGRAFPNREEAAFFQPYLNF